MDIFVGSLPFKLKEVELKELFEKYGNVTTVKLVKDKRTGQNKGYGFVEMPDENEAKLAIAALNGFEFAGRSIQVSKSESDKDNPGKPKKQPNRGNPNGFKFKSAGRKKSNDIVYPKDEERKKEMKKYTGGNKLAKNFKVGKRKKR